MLHSQLDHLVITAPSLAAGVDYVRDLLGVAPQPGGRHPRMGTHNALLKLGESAYLEVIAVDPEAPAPDLPRWFRLDRTPSPAPGLAAWVARTDAIEAAAALSPVFGRVEPMTRGALGWRITLTGHGELPFDGIAPLLIQWDPGPHPASLLADSGCALVGLEGFHPQAAAVAELLRGLGCGDGPTLAPTVPGRPPRLVAHIRTPAGLRALPSPGALDG
jgi:hypothetical protein